MSQTLTNRQKLRFLFGIFDKEDKDGLPLDSFWKLRCFGFRVGLKLGFSCLGFVVFGRRIQGWNLVDFLV